MNAASATGNLVIAGDTSSQSITGGRGTTSLWGGAGDAADTLSGNNSGTDMFWYGLGEGKDVLQNVGVEDVVNVYNINLANVTGAEIGNSSVAIKTTAGDTLTVNRTSGAATTTFQLADGSKWNANYSSKTWEQA